MKYVIATAAALIIGLSGQASLAKPVSLIGSWSGSGVTKNVKGDRGTANCQISYTKGSGKVYTVHANCSISRIGDISQTASLKKVGANRYSGTFRNHQHSVSGKFTVIVNGTSQTVIMSSERGSASVTLAKN